MKILPWVLSVGLAASAFAGEPAFSKRLAWEKEVEDKLGVDLPPVELVYKDFDETKDKTYNDSAGLLAYEDNKIIVFANVWKERGESKKQKTRYIHELGHHAVHTFLSSLDEEIYADRWYDDIATQIQNEGVATYFARQFLGPRPKAPWPETVEGLEERLKAEPDWAYKIGAQLVTPILDEFGVGEGIRRIYSQDPLTLDEMVHPRKYWGRMMPEKFETKYK